MIYIVVKFIHIFLLKYLASRAEIFLLILIYLCTSTRQYKSLKVLNDKFLSVILPVNR